MTRYVIKHKQFTLHAVTLIVLTLFAFWLKSMDTPGSQSSSGLINISFGFILLFAYVFAHLLKTLKLPLITGYIFAGILAGPYVSAFLSEEMLGHFQFIDDLALSFIAMSAGGELHLKTLSNRRFVIFLNVFFQILIISGLVYYFVLACSPYFDFTRLLAPGQIKALAILLGVIAIARSPASTIAIINETCASGVFTETVLGVTVIKDVLIIIIFTIALSFTKIVVAGTGSMDYNLINILLGEILISILLGVVSGKIIASYIKRVGRDIAVFVILFGFGITKLSLWLPSFMEGLFHVSFHFEPLLICISTGFTIQNFSTSGDRFMRSIDKVALPIYLLFFSLAGASLDLGALGVCWPLAVTFACVRILGVFMSTWLAGRINNDPPLFNRHAWMAYITQAGVAIGLAQIAARQFPEIGDYLSTVVLAVISVNQIIGPILFKRVLYIVGEARR
ncbi:MAG: cation:proton antiporter [Proteobacteria bacterium]|nr:cation:proton antiporter [Pseudomonadota bacterium]